MILYDYKQSLRNIMLPTKSFNVSSSILFSEHYFEPFEKPYQVGEIVDIFIGEGTLTTCKITNTSILNQIRMYELEFQDGSKDWFPLGVLKNNKFN